MIPDALNRLATIISGYGGTPQVDATPPRLVARTSGLPEKTPDHEMVAKGPPVSAGERALAGFAKKIGVDPAGIQKVDDYYVHRIPYPGRPLIEILAENLPGDILGIQWPKTMYWTGGKTGPRFIRPIRWIVGLLGNEVIDFEVAGGRCTSVTRGH